MIKPIQIDFDKNSENAEELCLFIDVKLNKEYF